MNASDHYAKADTSISWVVKRNSLALGVVVLNQAGDFEAFINQKKLSTHSEFTKAVDAIRENNPPHTDEFFT